MSDLVTEQVVSIIASVKQVCSERISLDTTFQAIGIDSLDAIVLLSELEDHFKIAISNDDARSIACVRDAVEGVKRLLAGLPSDTGRTSNVAMNEHLHD